ncbi:MAG: NAD(+)/NADH kinase [bacterium]|nr:NAD(+)/NADH kinase [bacterium]MCM1376009.1 NAD(+)/NADH kinase [Muribaculum sp.]
MKHFLIYTNCHKDRCMAITERIRGYLEAHGHRCTVILRNRGECNHHGEVEYGQAEGGESRFAADASCMIVLGGDGTMLQAAWEVRKTNIPLIGVNLGTLGYMTEVEPGCLEEALDQLMAGEALSESRMMLNGKIYGREGMVTEDWSLNDIVISRSGALQVIKMNIYVNGQFLKDYSADGVIVTTPTGSTGYNLSAGGPIAEPSSRLIIMTPICPHTLSSRSIILSPEDVIEIEIPEGREGRRQQVTANFDGAHQVPMCTGDRIRIVKSEKTTEILSLNRVSFLEVLHRKMRENE